MQQAKTTDMVEEEVHFSTTLNLFSPTMSVNLYQNC